MHRFMMALVLAGCAAPPGRYQIVPLQQVLGFDKTGGAMLIDSQTGQTWVQDFISFPKRTDMHFNALYWRPITRERPTTLPEIEK